MRSALLALALTVCSAAAYNVTLDDQSPLLIYNPPVGNPDIGKLNTKAWNVSYTLSKWSDWGKWSIPSGQSYHHAPEGATMHFTWEGTGIEINGQTDVPGFLGTAELLVDQQPGKCNGESDVVYCSMTGLTAGQSHTAVLTVTSGTIAIGSIVAMHDLSPENKVQVDNWQAYEAGNKINPKITSQGFTPGTTWSGKDGADIDYLRIMTNVTGAFASVKSPPKANLVEIWGSVDVDHQQYSVDVKPTPPNGIGTFNASAFNPWSTRDQILFMTELDPKTEYTIQFNHLSQSSEIWTDISQFTFVTHGDDDSSGLSGGAIAGIVIAILVGLAIVGALFWFFCRKRKRTAAETSHPLRGTIDDDNEEVYGPHPTPLSPHTGADRGSHSPFLSMHSAQSFPMSHGPGLTDSDAALLSMHSGGRGMSHMSSSGYTSSHSDPFIDGDGVSVTSVGYAGFGASAAGGQGSQPHLPFTKAQLARQSYASNGSAPVRHVYQQHFDGGSVIHNPDEPATLVEEVPPSYNPEWAGSSPHIHNQSLPSSSTDPNLRSPVSNPSPLSSSYPQQRS